MELLGKPKRTRVPGYSKSFEEFFYSIGIGISTATVIVNVLKVLTGHFFLYLVLLMAICGLGTVLFNCHFHILVKAMLNPTVDIDSKAANSSVSDSSEQRKTSPISKKLTLCETFTCFRRDDLMIEDQMMDHDTITSLNLEAGGLL